MSRRTVRVVSICLCVAVALTSCGGGSEDSVSESAPRSSTVETSIAPDVIAEENPFVAAGITITSIDAPVAGPGLTLTDWQSGNLLRAAEAGQGLTGSQLREDIPMPDGEMPMDLMVAAWVLEGGSPIARLAQPLMPNLDFDDPADVVIPSAVVVLFTHEAMIADAEGNVPDSIPVTQPVIVDPITVEQLEAAAEPNGFARPATTHPGAQGIRAIPSERATPTASPSGCTGLLAFQETVLGLVFDAVGGKDSYLGKKAQTAIGLLPKVALPYAIPGKGALDGLAVLGFVATLVGSVAPWTVSLEAEEDPIAYGVAPGVGVRGTVRAVVDPGPVLKWPDALKSCAHLIGVELPDINPIGGVVYWTPTFGGHATESSQDGVIMEINDRYEATYLYDTAVESADQATGTPTKSLLIFEAKVDRPGNETFDKVIAKIIDRYLGDGVIGSALNYLTADVAKTITDMSNPDPATLLVTVTFHDPPPDPESTAVVTVPPGPAGDEESACVGVDLYSQPMPGAATGVRLRLEPGHSLIWDFSSSQPYSVTDETGITATIQLGGAVTGSYSEVSDTQFTTSQGTNNLAGTVEVLGVKVPLDHDLFTAQGFDVISETLVCAPDGSITVERTQQVYR